MSKFKIVREILLCILAGSVLIFSCYDNISKEKAEITAKVSECRSKGGYFSFHERVCLSRIPLDSENNQ